MYRKNGGFGRSRRFVVLAPLRGKLVPYKVERSSRRILRVRVPYLSDVPLRIHPELDRFDESGIGSWLHVRRERMVADAAKVTVGERTHQHAPSASGLEVLTDLRAFLVFRTSPGNGVEADTASIDLQEESPVPAHLFSGCRCALKCGERYRLVGAARAAPGAVHGGTPSRCEGTLSATNIRHGMLTCQIVHPLGLEPRTAEV